MALQSNGCRRMGLLPSRRRIVENSQATLVTLTLLVAVVIYLLNLMSVLYIQSNA